MVKVNLSCNKSWRLIEQVECWASILLSHAAQLGQHSCQLYMPAVLYPQGNSFVPISVRGCVDPRATECEQKEQVTSKISKDPTRNRTWNCLSCGAVPQPTAQCLPPISQYNKRSLKKHIFYNDSKRTNNEGSNIHNVQNNSSKMNRKQLSHII